MQKTNNQLFLLKQPLLDSLINQLNESTIPANTGNLYYYGRQATKSDNHPVNTRTIDQMKNSGSFAFVGRLTNKELK